MWKLNKNCRFANCAILPKYVKKLQSPGRGGLGKLRCLVGMDFIGPPLPKTQANSFQAESPSGLAYL